MTQRVTYAGQHGKRAGFNPALASACRRAPFIAAITVYASLHPAFAAFVAPRTIPQPPPRPALESPSRARAPENNSRAAAPLSAPANPAGRAPASALMPANPATLPNARNGDPHPIMQSGALAARRPEIRACMVQWRKLKQQDAQKGETWRTFSARCLIQKR